MKLLRLSLLLVASAWVSGCAIYNRDLSSLEPYSEFSGEIVELEREMCLVDADGTGYFPYSSILLVEPNEYIGPNGWTWDKRWRQVSVLPKGTKIKIEGFQWVNGVDHAWVIAEGTTVREEMKFEYSIGSYRFPLRNPPWKGASDWPSMYVGWEGATKLENPRANKVREATP